MASEPRLRVTKALKISGFKGRKVGSWGRGNEVSSSQLLVEKILEMKFCVGGDLGGELLEG